jgi:hypothetical protein
MDTEFAVRQSDSAPTCEKPMVICFLELLSLVLALAALELAAVLLAVELVLLPQAASVAAASTAHRSRLMILFPFFILFPPFVSDVLEEL